MDTSSSGTINAVPDVDSPRGAFDKRTQINSAIDRSWHGDPLPIKAPVAAPSQPTVAHRPRWGAYMGFAAPTNATMLP
jgi:hypothetical protein